MLGLPCTMNIAQGLLDDLQLKGLDDFLGTELAFVIIVIRKSVVMDVIGGWHDEY